MKAVLRMAASCSRYIAILLEEISRAKQILKSTGAEDIASSGEKAISTHNVDSGRTQAGHLNPDTRFPTELRNEELDRDVTVDPLKVR